MINIRANRIKSKVNGFYKTIESYPFGEESIKFLKNYKGQKQENLKEEFIKFKQNEFIQEFEKYFKSNEYKEELANLKKYLISVKEEKPDLTNKFHKLTEAIKINNLDITLFEKCYQIEKIIPTSEEIWFLLAPFFVTCTRNSFIKKCFEIYEMLDKYEKGYIVPDMEGEILKEEIFKIYNAQANPLMLEKLKTDFLNKYKKYFQSQSYKNKVDRLDLFFRKSKALPENSSLYKLEKMISICKENFSDYEKVFRIERMVEGKLDRIFQMIAPYAVTYLDNEFIKEAMQVYFFIKKYEQDLKLIRIDAKYLNYFKEEENFLKYAEFVINYYIESKTSYDTYGFLETLGIDDLIFDDCIKTVSIFNNSLYGKFLIKDKENKEIRLKVCYQDFEDILYAIRNGCFKDGTELTLLEFFLRVPFKDLTGSNRLLEEIRNNYGIFSLKRDFLRKIRGFVQHFLGREEGDIIIKYMDDSNLKDGQFRSIRNLAIDQNTKSFIGDTLITDELKELVLNYMDNKNYPMIKGVYKIVLKKYLDGEIDEEEIRKTNTEKKPILIPSK